jgi:hypothetical protein
MGGIHYALWLLNISIFSSLEKAAPSKEKNATQIQNLEILSSKFNF